MVTDQTQKEKKKIETIKNRILSPYTGSRKSETIDISKAINEKV